MRARGSRAARAVMSLSVCAMLSQACDTERRRSAADEDPGHARRQAEIFGGTAQIEVEFADRSTEIDDRSREVLDRLRRAVSRRPPAAIVVEGRASEMDRRDANLDLAESRAVAVSAYLALAGMDDDVRVQVERIACSSGERRCRSCGVAVTWDAPEGVRR